MGMTNSLPWYRWPTRIHSSWWIPMKHGGFSSSQAVNVYKRVTSTTWSSDSHGDMLGWPFQCWNLCRIPIEIPSGAAVLPFSHEKYHIFRAFQSHGPQMSPIIHVQRVIFGWTSSSTSHWRYPGYPRRLQARQGERLGVDQLQGAVRQAQAAEVTDALREGFFSCCGLEKMISMT